MALSTQQQAVELISRAKNILVITREHATTDSLAAAIAAGLLLQKLKKPFDVVVPGWSQAVPSYLPSQIGIRPAPGALRAFHLQVNVNAVPLSELMYDVKDGRLDITLVPKHGSWSPQDVAFKHGEERYDLVLALDCPDRQSLGAIARDQADFLYRTPIINVDCSSTNEYWGQVNLVDLNAVATCEVLHDWITGWNPNLINEPLATSLLAGMVARTNSFRTPNVTPKTLAASSRLVELGAKRADIVQGLWRTRSVQTLKLWGRALSRLDQDRETGLVWTTLTEADFVETGSTPEALDGVVEELIAYAPEARAVALISQHKSATLVGLHVQPPLSAAELARPFGGTGTRERARFPFAGTEPLPEATQKIVARLKETLKAIK